MSRQREEMAHLIYGIKERTVIIGGRRAKSVIFLSIFYLNIYLL